MNSGNFMETITIVKIAIGVVIIAAFLLSKYIDRKNETLLAENQDWLKR
ncbi:MAG: hypothetical protein KA045_01970 [Burkholderiaceae bacterium]|jgi:C4-dicarboxylate transporter|nr:hypothetical protein [Burkholderiaceae bacterium]